MESRYVFILIFILIILDALAINSSYALAYIMVDKNSQHISFGLLALAFNLSWWLSAMITNLYSYKSVQTNQNISQKTILSFLGQVTLLVSLEFLSRGLLFNGGSMFLILLAEVVTLSLIRVIIYLIQISFPGLGSYKKRIAIVGHNELSEKLADFFHQNKLSVNVSKHFKYVNEPQDDSQLNQLKNDIQFAIENQLDEVYTTLFPEDYDELKSAIRLADQHFVRVKFVTTEVKYKHRIAAFTRLNYNLSGYYGDMPVLVNRVEPLNSVFNRIIKRLFDIAFALAVIVFILSWLIPIMAIIIRIESSGPTFFMQLRSGKNNKPFWCYKFRSMCDNHDKDQKQATRKDPRITRIGAFMRKTSIDELPQFFNVLLGDMSIVGPRPHMLKHTDEYREVVDKYMVRLFAKPGITGWAQVNGFRGETKDKLLMEKRVECDLWYLENWSVLFDLKIILLTITNVFKGEDNAF